MKNKMINVTKKIISLLIISLTFWFCFQSDINTDLIKSTPEKKLLVDQWNGNITSAYEITNINNTANVMQYVYFTDFIANLSTYKSKDINTFTIVLEKALDLQYISMLMNDVPTGLNINANDLMEPSWYLSLNYVLGNDLTFKGEIIYPMGNSRTPFTGTFDGQGFALIDLFLTQLDAEKYQYYQFGGQDCLEYYALFSYTSEEAIIRNLRLVDPYAAQIYTINEAIFFAAPLVGKNEGLIENCSVTSVSYENKKFTIRSEITVATMVCYNTSTGIIRNSFVGVVDDIFTAELTGMSHPAYPVIYRNDEGGEIINVYCDMERFISEVSDINPDIQEIYHTSDFQNPLTFDTAFVNVWFFNNSYSNVTLTAMYPELIGLRLYRDTIDTYEITKATDLLAFSRLVEKSSVMAHRNYILTHCIDMSSIARNLYVAPKEAFYGVFSSAIVEENDECDYNHNVSSATTKYHGIWYLTTNQASTGDVTSYAFINQLAGMIKNINFVNYRSELSDASSYTTNTIYTGTVAGKVLNGGLIDNVNVYGSINLPSNKSYGAIYIGGLVGINSGSIINSTFSGQIDGGIQLNSGNLRTTNGIGGIAGFSSNGVFNNVKNTASLIGISFTGTGASTNTTNTTYLGGIVGCGDYSSLQNVVNTGLIISSHPQGYLANTYVGGIISKLENVNSLTLKAYNRGEIRLIVADNEYINNYHAAGFGTISTNNTIPITLKNVTNAGKVSLATNFSVNAGVYTFTQNFHDYVNLNTDSAGTIVNPDGSDNIGGAIKLTGTIIIDSNTAANLEGIFQTHDQTVDLGIIYRYAPVIYSLNMSTSYVINVTKAYNTGNIDFITTRPMYNGKVQITGNTYGDYIFFNYLRNEGNLTFDITYPSENTFDIDGTLTDFSSNFRISGLVGTLNNYNSSQGYYLYNSYNGGNITIKNWNENKTALMSGISVTAKTQTLQYMLYIGGLAFKNNNTVDVEAQDKVIIASTRKGGIHNCLNNGQIYVDVNLYGCTRLGGITALNSGLISSSFNTGNIYNYTALYINPSTAYNSDMGNNQFEVEAGGITCMITASTGQIMDCANYGDVMCVQPLTNGYGNGWLNAGGIVGRNEKDETNYGNTTGNWRGKIEFCVNYGNIYAWNSYNESFGDFLNGTSNTQYMGAESSCKAAGIIAIGVINVINCANYGNIYSRYLAGGIFGLVDGTKFKDINDDVYIANSINYGEVRRIYEFVKDSPTLRSSFKTTTDVPAARTVTINSSSYTINSMYGGAMGYIYGHSSWSRDGLSVSNNSGSLWNESNVVMLKKLKISFLINFDEKTDIIGSQTVCLRTANLTIDYAKMVQYMATIKETDTSMYPFNATSYGIEEYNLSDQDIIGGKKGIFSQTFPLRGGTLDESIITNKYIRNYINFVDYQYTNHDLVNNIFSEDQHIGIYAVASSKGILNGKYLPDNIEWGTVDYPGLDPVENNHVNDTWRGEITDVNSINYKFKKGMKQLENSIATTIYDLQLVDVDDATNIIDAPMIDNDNRIITFYIGDNENKEKNNTLFGKSTISNPIVNTTNKTIVYQDNQGNIVLSYSYSTGTLVRTDNNNTFVQFDPQDTLTIPTYIKINSYSSNNFTNYYVTKDGGQTYIKAKESDRLYTITTSTSWSSRKRYKTETTNGITSYLYSSSNATVAITNNQEVTNRNNPSGPFYYRTSSSNSSYPNYMGIGNTITPEYVLYQQVYITYPTIVDIYESDAHYDNLFTVDTTDDTYQLAEGAKLVKTGTNAASNVRIKVPAVVNGNMTSSTENAGTKYLYIQSEAGTYTTYEIRIARTISKNLKNATVTVRDGATYVTTEGSIILRNGAVEVNLDKTTAKTLDINFDTINMPDKQDLLINTKLKKLNSSTGEYDEYADKTALLETIYTITGGQVVNKSDIDNEMTGEKEPAPIREDGTFPDGTVNYTLTFGNLISAGTYQMQITIGTSIYYVQFNVARSNGGVLEEFTYADDFSGESSWVNPGSENELLTTILFDANVSSYLMAMATTTPMDWDHITLPETGYISDLKISPYAKITSISYNQVLAKTYYQTILNLNGANYQNDNVSKLYIITYHIQAEDGTNKTFTHYIVEASVNTSIQQVYMDGINQGIINEISFVRTHRPSIKIFYDFAHINVKEFANFNATITYSYDTAKYPKQANGSENALILDSISIPEFSTNGITINFNNDVACEYTITLTYTRENDSSAVLTYQMFRIHKTNNTDSSLVRVLFSTESPFTTLGTIIYNGHQISTHGDVNYVPAANFTTNQPLLTPDIYRILNSDDNLRVIKSMPNLIYYNNALPKKLYDPNDSNVVYNRYDVIGFVSKTDLTNYLPTFALPTGAVIYQLDSNNQPIVDINNQPILSANFINNDDANTFNFVHYRIYSEASSVDSNGFCIPNANNDNYTDYYVYVVDVSYNVYFDIEFNYASNDVYQQLAQNNEKLLASFYRYEPVIEGDVTFPDNKISVISNIYYFFNFDSTDPTNYQHYLSATTSGFFKLKLELPEEYTYTYLFSGDTGTVTHNNDDYFFVEGKIFAYRYKITITIDWADNNGNWGQHGSISLENN